MIDFDWYEDRIKDICSGIDEHSSSFEKYDTCKQLDELGEELREGNKGDLWHTTVYEASGKRVIAITIVDCLNDATRNVYVDLF